MFVEFEKAGFLKESAWCAYVTYAPMRYHVVYVDDEKHCDGMDDNETCCLKATTASARILVRLFGILPMRLFAIRPRRNLMEPSKRF